MKNFTPNAQQVLAFARREASGLKHSYVGTEHLLLGFLKLRGCKADKILRKKGLLLGSLRKEVIHLVGKGKSARPGPARYTNNAKMALAYANREAVRLKASYVDTMILLDGLLRLTDCVAIRALRNFEVSNTRLYMEILEEDNLGQRPAKRDTR